jgi:pantetheine-phosphate adenylyltransferase
VTTALYAGSFDPMHLGHLSVVERAAAIFDEVVVAVLGNPAKTSGRLPIDDRVRLIIESTTHLGNVRTLVHDGLTVDAAARCGADVLVRSGHKERTDERTMAAMNERVSGLRTSFVGAEPGTSWISASLVRDCLARGRIDDVRRMVPRPVFTALVPA